MDNILSHNIDKYISKYFYKNLFTLKRDKLF